MRAVMDFNEYQALANRTAKPLEPTDNLLHAALGLAGEAGEFVDAVKKHYIYNKPLDRENLIEEVGDILWFCALAAKELGHPLGTIAEENIDKLRKRYPSTYSDEHAHARMDKA